MELIADILLIAGAIGASVYCFVLARRLNRFNNLENGVGGAVAVLSAQVDDLTRTLAAAQSASESSHAVLADLTTRAETVSGRLELMMASMHDISDAPESKFESPRATSSAVEPTVSDPDKDVMFVRRDRPKQRSA